MTDTDDQSATGARLMTDEAAAGLPTRLNPHLAALVYVAVMMLAVGLGGPILAVVVVPSGWWALLASAPLYLAHRWLLLRLGGTESADFAVDSSGVIHLVAGERSVRMLTRLFDVGAARWLVPAYLATALTTVVYLVVPAMVAAVLDLPAIAIGIFLLFSWAMLDLVRYVLVLHHRRRRLGVRRLDGKQMLPLMALYARHHGVPAVTFGVPADQLSATLAAADFAELNTVRGYRTINGVVEGVAGTMTRLGASAQS